MAETVEFDFTTGQVVLVSATGESQPVSELALLASSPGPDPDEE